MSGLAETRELEARYLIRIRAQYACGLTVAIPRTVLGEDLDR